MILGGYGRPALRRAHREGSGSPFPQAVLCSDSSAALNVKFSLLISLWAVLVILLSGQGIIWLVSFSTEAGFAAPGHLHWRPGLSQIRIQALDFFILFFYSVCLKKAKAQADALLGIVSSCNIIRALSNFPGESRHHHGPCAPPFPLPFTEGSIEI